MCLLAVPSFQAFSMVLLVTLSSFVLDPPVSCRLHTPAPAQCRTERWMVGIDTRICVPVRSIPARALAIVGLWSLDCIRSGVESVFLKFFLSYRTNVTREYRRISYEFTRTLIVACLLLKMAFCFLFCDRWVGLVCTVVQRS